MTDGTELIAGRYRLISRIGSGAMGVVWRARDERLGRTVAVKQLRSPIGMSTTQIEQAQQRARREARIAARLQHPHAVAVFDVAEHDGRPCLVMEYVPSRSLSEVLADGGALPAARVAVIGAQLASALVAAHEAGIVHRDIKPGNILVTEAGAVKLTDFGISRATGDVTLTGTGEMLGTPAFTSPEVAQGRTAGASSDVFSLGATLYAALEGTPPFGTGPNAMALLLRIVNDEIRPPEHVGPLMSTLLWMLRHEPMDRPSMDVVRRELESTTDETVSVLAVDVSDAAVADAVAEGESGGGSGGVSGDGGDEAGDGGDGGKTPVKAAEGDEALEGAAREGAEVAAGDVATQEAAKAGTTAKAGKAAKTGKTGGAGDASAADAVTAPADPASQSPKSGPRRPTRAFVLPASLLLAAAVVTAGIVAAITASNGGSGAPGATATRTTTATRTSPAAAPTASVHASSLTKTSASATSASPTADTAQQLKTAIVDYYRLMPGNLSTAWNHLTPDYQQNTAKGMSGYSSFWGQIQSVAVSNVSAEPPSTVVATLVYHYKNGNVVRERTSFQLVRQGGMWKIAHSSVLSSNSQ